MIEGLIVFVVGYVCGKYTDQVIAFTKKMYNKYFGNSEKQ